MKDERQHYFDLGIEKGKQLFNFNDFIWGLSIGFSIGVLIMYFFGN